MKDEVAQLWVRGNRSGRRARPEERRRRGLLASARCPEEGEGRNGTGQDRNLRGVREDKGADAEVGRDCRRVERRRRAQ